MSNTLKRGILGALLSIGFLAGCTKDIPYKYEYKEQVLDKSLIDSNADYLYVPSMGNSSRTSTETRPYWMGDQKRVHLKFNETTLQIFEMEDDARYAGNSTNNKLVMEIPVQHLQYRCAQDSYGECTNKEEENNDISWNAKTQFKPDFTKVNFVEASILPVEVQKIFGDSCYTEAGSKFLGYEVTDKSINFEIEKTFSANAKCMSGAASLSDFTTTAVFHYSLVKLDAMASKDYQAISYPLNDENTFGFFKTEQHLLDVDNRLTQNNKTELLNRWNPNKKEVVYYLSPEFNKPENAKIKEAAQISVNKINSGLATSGAQLRLTLKDNSGQVPGDIQNNMIVLVEDPTASGVIGYGPTTSDPRTGEILSGRVIMYLGTMEKYVKYSYEEIRKDKLAQKQQLAAFHPSTEALKNYALMLKAKAATSVAQSADGDSQTQQLQKDTLASLGLINSQAKISSVLRPTQAKTLLKSNVSAAMLSKIQKDLNDYTANTVSKTGFADKYAVMSGYCAYPADLFNFDGAVDKALVGKFGDTLKPWEDLSSDEKKSVMDIIIPNVWVPTLVHELGHNLGLRHNFAGSEDKANFYTDAELQGMGIDHKIPYSSVMDYGYSDLNSLPTLGKYDIAALKYAYQRQVETTDGQIVSVATTLDDLENKGGVKLKAYKFCTDESVGANAGCKRFDEGTNDVEIAQQLVRRYNEKYSVRNFRIDANNFSLAQDMSYAEGIESLFTELRTFMEVYERIKYTYNIADDDPAWTQIAFLKDLKDATIIAGQFFMDVLKTPDLTCALQKTSDSKVIIDTLASINAALHVNAISCEELELSEYGLTLLGHMGKNFRSLKSEKSTNPYVDQIDVRGIWIDKILAAKYLFNRKIYSLDTLAMYILDPRFNLGDDNFSFNKYQDNFTDIPELKDSLSALGVDMVVNQVQTNVDIQTVDGDVVTIPWAIDTFGSHVIAANMDDTTAKVLGIAVRSNSYFVESLLEIMATPKDNSSDEDNAFADIFRVKRYSSVFDEQLKSTVVQTTLGSTEYVALPENQVAVALIKAVNVNADTEKIPFYKKLLTLLPSY